MNLREVLMSVSRRRFTPNVELPVLLVMVEEGRIVDVRAESSEFLETVLTAQELDDLFSDNSDVDDADIEEFPRTITF